MTKIKNAGAIFLGEYSSEPLGDYFAGPNHVLPTNGTAKFFSALSVDDFIKKSSIISYSRNALEEIHNDIETFATAEHLTAHANSIKVRFEKSDIKSDVMGRITFLPALNKNLSESRTSNSNCRQASIHRKTSETDINLF